MQHKRMNILRTSILTTASGRAKERGLVCGGLTFWLRFGVSDLSAGLWVCFSISQRTAGPVVVTIFPRKYGRMHYDRTCARVETYSRMGCAQCRAHLMECCSQGRGEGIVANRLQRHKATNNAVNAWNMRDSIMRFYANDRRTLTGGAGLTFHQNAWCFRKRHCRLRW